jgi:hypothetical protein
MVRLLSFFSYYHPICVYFSKGDQYRGCGVHLLAAHLSESTLMWIVSTALRAQLLHRRNLWLWPIRLQAEHCTYAQNSQELLLQRGQCSPSIWLFALTSTHFHLGLTDMAGTAQSSEFVPVEVWRLQGRGGGWTKRRVWSTCGSKLVGSRCERSDEELVEGFGCLLRRICFHDAFYLCSSLSSFPLFTAPVNLDIHAYIF